MADSKANSNLDLGSERVNVNFMCAQSINPGNLFLKKGREPVLNSAAACFLSFSLTRY